MDKNIEQYIDKAARQAAKATVHEFKASGALKDPKTIIYRDMSSRLLEFYKGEKSDPGLANALLKLSEDMYFDIIPLYYCTGNTIENIAEGFEVEISTITRNKKRLCIEIYKLLEEEE
jgi:hypothetical protein